MKSIKELMAKRVKDRLNSAPPDSKPTPIESASSQLNPTSNDVVIKYMTHIRAYVQGAEGITSAMFDEALEWLSKQSCSNAQVAAMVCLEDEKVLGKGPYRNSPLDEEKALTYYKRAFFHAIEENEENAGDKIDKILKSIWPLYAQNRYAYSLLNILEHDADNNDTFAALWLGWCGIPEHLRREIQLSDCMTCSDLYDKKDIQMPNRVLEALLKEGAIPSELQSVSKDNATQTMDYLKTVCANTRQQEQYRVHECARVFHNFIWTSNCVKGKAAPYTWSESAKAFQIECNIDDPTPSVAIIFDDAVNEVMKASPFWEQNTKAVKKPVISVDYDDTETTNTPGQINNNSKP